MSNSTVEAATESITHAKLRAWVEEIAELTKPDAIHVCDGSAEEYDALCNLLVDNGTFSKLSDAKRPNSYLALLGPVRRGPRRRPHLHLLGHRENDAGPTNNWTEPAEMRETLNGLFDGCHEGPHDVRGPVLDGPARLDKSHIGVELTDSPYVAASMRIMTRMGPRRSTSSAPTASSSRACTRSAIR